MKLAIVLTGNLRTWDYCKDSFITSFGCYNPDLYLVTDTLRYGYHPCVQWTIGDHEDELVDDDKIRTSFEGLNLIDYKIFPRGVSNFTKCAPAFANNVNSFIQFEKLWYAMDLIKRTSVDYDFILKTRCDLIYTENIKNAFYLENDQITIDSSNEFPNDCIYVTNSNNMVKLANFMYNEVLAPIYPDSHEIEPHGLLRNAVNHLNLKFNSLALMDSVVRKGNKHYSYKK